MEKLVPLLIALAIFGFKSYQNYMKEQDAALKRRKANAPIPSKNKTEPPAYQPSQKEKNVVTPPPFYSEKIKDTNEIQRFKKEREEHRLALNKKNKLPQSLQKEPMVTEDFDLRKAVIMSIILDRPYK
ncbi:hypothetical protein EDF67_10287 [Sphingobacterium sp. JUb78]|jgi:hypothetical protein|nr:hypothetical protein L950_0205945 [Sphingobacterium sp. IITKGP-BTPF85]TCR12684.1 hypothetical protein EDF67_10287 [Sphingobacterium sp. JUb78]